MNARRRSHSFWQKIWNICNFGKRDWLLVHSCRYEFLKIGRFYVGCQEAGMTSLHKLRELLRLGHDFWFVISVSDSEGKWHGGIQEVKHWYLQPSSHGKYLDNVKLNSYLYRTRSDIINSADFYHYVNLLRITEVRCKVHGSVPCVTFCRL